MEGPDAARDLSRWELSSDGQPPRIALVLLAIGSQNYTDFSLANKLEYCERANYVCRVFTKSLEADRPAAWNKVLAAQIVLEEGFDWIWLLDLDTLIMNTTLRLETHILKEFANALTPNIVESFHPNSTTARANAPNWYLPDSEIFPIPATAQRLLKQNTASVLISADCHGLNSGSMLIRNSPWTKKFLPLMWEIGGMDKEAVPQLWRYNAVVLSTPAKDQAGVMHIAEKDILYANSAGHIRVIPQQVFNAYPFYCGSKYIPGDFVVHFPGCTKWHGNCDAFFARFGNIAKELSSSSSSLGPETTLYLENIANSTAPTRMTDLARFEDYSADTAALTRWRRGWERSEVIPSSPRERAVVRTGLGWKNSGRPDVEVVFMHSNGTLFDVKAVVREIRRVLDATPVPRSLITIYSRLSPGRAFMESLLDAGVDRVVAVTNFGGEVAGVLRHVVEEWDRIAERTVFVGDLDPSQLPRLREQLQAYLPDASPAGFVHFGKDECCSCDATSCGLPLNSKLSPLRTLLTSQLCRSPFRTTLGSTFAVTRTCVRNREKSLLQYLRYEVSAPEEEGADKDLEKAVERVWRDVFACENAYQELREDWDTSCSL
ncbi:hypothetical protein HDU93_001230 [Gonapodya sp. JEL0774]|nr:hypothetical protein HDU93_001230 [Gonapodya sp. JEL0774]